VFTMHDFELARCDPEHDIIIIAIICDGKSLYDIWRQLTQKGYKHIIYFHEVYSLLLTNRLGTGKNNDHHLTQDIAINLSHVTERVLNFANFLKDEESQHLFLNFINGILSSDPDLFSKQNIQTQYFVEDIPFSKGYSRFIDCGAYVGDTALTLRKTKGIIQAIACFEPDLINFNKLCVNLKTKRVGNEQLLFPCGVWEKTQMLSFLTGNNTASSICESGESSILGVALDDIIPDFRPTFIKMDVEGAEYEALLGVQNTISHYKPDLAISVYHRIDHMWEIPLLLKTFNSSYNFYLRCHGSHGLETVLYAVSI